MAFHLPAVAVLLLAPIVLVAGPIQRRDQWIAAHLKGENPPYSFTCAEKPAGLETRLVTRSYPDHPFVEWTLYIKNTGPADTPVLSDIRGIDVNLDVPDATLHHNTGSPCTPTDYAPHETPLPPGESKRISTSGGRPTNSDLPYFNLAARGGGGMIVALGWGGQWTCDFSSDGKTVRVTGGQELTHLRLHPGEEIRAPLAVLGFYDGDWIDGQNVWRRWMVDCNLPRVDGRLPPPEITPCSSHQFGEMVRADEQSQITFIDRYLEERIPISHWWMDAGWYVLPDGSWPNTGTWQVDRKRFPRGLRAISDHAHGKGVKTIVWFEPERVTPNTELYEKREWLLGKDGEQKLLNMGNPQARRWVTDRVLSLLETEGIDLYRQDFNMDPLAFWRDNDPPDRQGITEIRYVAGYLAHFDELLARRPGLRIDTCASGGRRNDLETLRRAVPFLRSDCILEPLAQQQHTYGIAMWIPYFGTGLNAADDWTFRSQMCPHLIACYDVRERAMDYEALRRRIAEWQRVAPLMQGDFYPLSPYSHKADQWLAWQFNDAKARQGFVQAFRRPECADETIMLKLRGLDANVDYVVEDADAPGERVVKGRELAGGFRFKSMKRPHAAMIHYRAK